MRVFNNITCVIKRITDIMSVIRYGTNLPVNALLETTLLDLRRHSRDVCSKKLQYRQVDADDCNLSVSPQSAK